MYNEVLVTGGAGAIGSNLVRSLIDAGSHVTVIDDLSSAPAWNIPEKARFIQGSVLNEEILKYAFSFKPEVVFHLAALFANQNSVEHPETDLKVNGLGTLNVLQHSQLVNAKVVYASTSSVYGKDVPLPYSEESVSLKVSTPYQASKLVGEAYCCFFTEYYGLPTVRLRFFNSYGPGELPGKYRNVIPNFIDRALKGLPLIITGTGEETRDFTYVEDIVKGIIQASLLDSKESEAINLGTGAETTILEIAQLINEKTGNEKIEFGQQRKWDVKNRRVADISKARTLLGYNPVTKLAEGLDRTITWFHENSISN